MGLIVCAAQPKPTKGFGCFWAFAAERQQIYLRKLAGDRGRLTNDAILASNRFTNAYRASDRVSQYLIREVQYRSNWSWADTFARTLIFKIFNRVDTWEHLVADIGEPTVDALMDGDVDRSLSKIAGRRPIYSAAYIMPPPRSFDGPKYSRHLALLRRMVTEEAHEAIASSPTMEQSFGVLRSYESFGDFLAYQFITDLNYSRHLGFSEQEFVVPGPGAVRGLRKVFGLGRSISDRDLIQWTLEQQASEFERRGLPWEGLWGRDLQLIDIQNLFCEVDKYTRVAMPELSKYAPGSRIKQRYRPENAPMSAWFPPKWGINQAADSVSTFKTNPGQLELLGPFSTSQGEFSRV